MTKEATYQYAMNVYICLTYCTPNRGRREKERQQRRPRDKELQERIMREKERERESVTDRER